MRQSRRHRPGRFLMSGYFLIQLVGVVLLLSLCAVYVHDRVSCVIERSERSSINGYYRLSDQVAGLYLHYGYELSSLPDVFDIYVLKRYRRWNDPVMILSNNNAWVIAVPSQQASHTQSLRPVYHNLQTQVTNHPPANGWIADDGSATPSALIVTYSTGNYLQAAKSTQRSPRSNLQQLLDYPMNTLILTVIILIAFYLWDRRVEVAAVSFSYESVVVHQQYWRVITASLSHFDIMHIGFNAMSLYQLRQLEDVYGSMMYLYLSFDLIIITILICVLIHALLIYKYNMQQYYVQQSIGYSCVIFAWIVAISVRMEEYCPIFFFPSFCLKTYSIPLPFLHSLSSSLPESIAVNLGPFVLLIFTSMIIPRASFVGHLAGIVIGYPLAWNALNWLTPPKLASLLLIAHIVMSKLYVWTYPRCFEMSFAALADAVPANVFSLLNALLYLTLMLTLCLPLWWMGGDLFTQVLLRAVQLFLVWSCLYAKKVAVLTTSTTVESDCRGIMLLTIFVVASVLVYDLCTLVTMWSGMSILIGSGLTQSFIYLMTALLLATIAIELAYASVLLLLLHETEGAWGTLAMMAWDRDSIKRDWDLVKRWCPRPSTTPFAGQARTLSAPTTHEVGDDREVVLPRPGPNHYARVPVEEELETSNSRTISV